MSKKIGIAVAVIIAIIALTLWAIPLAPQKDVIVITKEIPLNAEEQALSGEKELVAYCVYYIWDGEREEYPWWSIVQDPSRDFDWIVLETADIDVVYDTDSFIKAVNAASKFDEIWFDHEMHTVQRSRVEKLRHAFFGGDSLEKERKAIEQILDSIHLGEG